MFLGLREEQEFPSTLTPTPLPHPDFSSAMQEAECSMIKRNAELSANTAIANSEREYKTLSAGYTEEINQKVSPACFRQHHHHTSC